MSWKVWQHLCFLGASEFQNQRVQGEHQEAVGRELPCFRMTCGFLFTPFGPIAPLGHFERCWKLRCTCGSGQQLEEESVSQVLQVQLPTVLHLNCQHLHDLNSPLLATDYQG